MKTKPFSVKIKEEFKSEVNILLIKYNSENIERVSIDFFEATGINLLILDQEFKPLKYIKNSANRYCSKILGTQAGKNACTKSDRTLLEQCKASKSVQTHICHAGLLDIALPILYKEQIAGYIILGQIKTSSDFSEIKKRLANLPIDADSLNEDYESLVNIEEKRISAIINIAVMLSKYIIFEKLINLNNNKVIDKAIAYIDENIEKKLNAYTVAKEIYISKSTLYQAFHTHFHCTVGEYIYKVKIERAQALFEETDLSVSEVSDRLCFSDVSYFSRIFKKVVGTSPIKYRNQLQAD